MLSIQPVSRISRGIMIKEGGLPPFYVMAGFTDLICKLSFVRIIVAV